MTDTELEQLCEALANDLRSLPARVRRARGEEQEAKDAANRQKGVLAAERAAHDRMIDDSTAKHQAKVAAREKELAGRESAVAAREQAVAADRERVQSAQSWLDHQKADLRNRYSGAA